MLRGRFASSLKGVLQGEVQESVQPGFLRPIDVNRIAHDLDLDRVGLQRGSEELPDSAGALYDGVEQAIIQRVEAEFGWQGGEFINQLQAYASRLVMFSIHAEFHRLQLSADAALTGLRGVSHQAESELGPLREHYIAARDELTDFKRKHRLKRPARGNRRPWTTLGLMTILVGFESVLNGVFFAEGSEFGLAGGILIAVGISFVNVVLGVGSMAIKILDGSPTRSMSRSLQS